jgi:hypothetical protein
MRLRGEAWGVPAEEMELGRDEDEAAWVELVPEKGPAEQAALAELVAALPALTRRAHRERAVVVHRLGQVPRAVPMVPGLALWTHRIHPAWREQLPSGQEPAVPAELVLAAQAPVVLILAVPQTGGPRMERAPRIPMDYASPSQGRDPLRLGPTRSQAERPAELQKPAAPLVPAAWVPISLAKGVQPAEVQGQPLAPQAAPAVALVAEQRPALVHPAAHHPERRPCRTSA